MNSTDFTIWARSIMCVLIGNIKLPSAYTEATLDWFLSNMVGGTLTRGVWKLLNNNTPATTLTPSIWLITATCVFIGTGHGAGCSNTSNKGALQWIYIFIHRPYTVSFCLDLTRVFSFTAVCFLKCLFIFHI